MRLGVKFGCLLKKHLVFKGFSLQLNRENVCNESIALALTASARNHATATTTAGITDSIFPPA